MKLFHRFGASVHYVGVGINTNNKTELLLESIREALSLSKHFLVRDKDSRDYIRKEIDPTFDSLVPDPIYLNDLAAKGDSDDRLLFCSYRCVDRYFSDAVEYREAFINNLVNVMNENQIDKVLCCPSDRAVDYRDNIYISTELEKRNTGRQAVEFVASMPMEEIMSYISRSTVVVTGRLHVGVVAALYGVPQFL